MKFSIVASALALSSTALAHAGRTCVTHKQAVTLVNRFLTLMSHENSDLGDPQTTGEAILVEDYVEVSDSILSLEGLPLGGVTFQGRDNYLNGVLHAPANLGAETLGIYTVGCHKVLWYWNFPNVGTKQSPVKGFNLFTLNNQGQIAKTELEFNSIAWGQDTFQLPCGGAPPAPSASAVVSASASIAPSEVPSSLPSGEIRL